jgi:hypothetical protein
MCENNGNEVRDKKLGSDSTGGGRAGLVFCRYKAAALLIRRPSRLSDNNFSGFIENAQNDTQKSFRLLYQTHGGPCSSVGIATGYVLDGPGLEARWRRYFPHPSGRPWGPPSLLYNGYRVFPGGRQRPGRDADSSPLLVLWSKTEYSYTFILPKGLRGL